MYINKFLYIVLYCIITTGAYAMNYTEYTALIQQVNEKTNGIGVFGIELKNQASKTQYLTISIMANNGSSKNCDYTFSNIEIAANSTKSILLLKPYFGDNLDSMEKTLNKVMYESGTIKIVFWDGEKEIVKNFYGLLYENHYLFVKVPNLIYDCKNRKLM